MPDQVAEIYIDIKQAAQILNNVSIRTAYRYIDKGSVGLTIATTTGVENNTVKKLYRKEDIIALSRALNKDRTILVQVPVNVRPAAIETNRVAVLDERVTEPTKDFAVIPFKAVVRLTFSTLLVQVLTVALILFFLYRWVEAGKAENRNFWKEYRDSRLIQKIEDEQRNFFGL